MRAFWLGFLLALLSGVSLAQSPTLPAGWEWTEVGSLPAGVPGVPFTATEAVLIARCWPSAGYCSAVEDDLGLLLAGNDWYAEGWDIYAFEAADTVFYTAPLSAPGGASSPSGGGMGLTVADMSLVAWGIGAAWVMAAAFVYVRRGLA